MVFNKENGFYKYYNKEGKEVRIKFTDIQTITIDSEVLFKLHYPNDLIPSMYVPKKKFKTVYDVINHICKNLDTDKLKVEVSLTRSSKTL